MKYTTSDDPVVEEFWSTLIKTMEKNKNGNTNMGNMGRQHNTNNSSDNRGANKMTIDVIQYSTKYHVQVKRPKSMLTVEAVIRANELFSELDRVLAEQDKAIIDLKISLENYRQWLSQQIKELQKES